jgi:hypothetical protein
VAEFVLPGGKRGNAGGGRPRDVIREAYLDPLSTQGVLFIRELVEGKVRVRLPQVCEHCGKEPTGKGRNLRDDILQLLPSTEVRLRAIDIASRYGLGGRDEITVVSPDVVDRLACQASAIAQICPPDMADALVRRLEEVWS